MILATCQCQHILIAELSPVYCCLVPLVLQSDKIFLRSDYFQKAEDFKEALGETTKVMEVKECPYQVLETVIDFMYGIDIPDNFSSADVESLLFMADLYLMEDLKGAIAAHVATRLNKSNILETLSLAEKFTAQKLVEACTDFIVTNVSVANQVLGLGAASIYHQKKIGPNNPLKKDMIVRCNTTTNWHTDAFTGLSSPLAAVPSFTLNATRMRVIEVGTIGRVIDESSSKVIIKWKPCHEFSQENAPRGTVSHLDILTPPIDTTLFKDPANFI